MAGIEKGVYHMPRQHILSVEGSGIRHFQHIGLPTSLPPKYSHAENSNGSIGVLP